MQWDAAYLPSIYVVMVIGGNFVTFGGCNMGCHQIATRVHQSVKECARVWNSALQYGKSLKSVKDHRCWLLIEKNYQFYYINKVFFCILLGFDYFEIGISIYLWHRRLTLVVCTAPVTLVDGAKQAGPVSCSGSYWSKSRPLAIFFKVETLGDH